MNRLYFCTVFRLMQELNAVCLNYLQFDVSNQLNSEANMNPVALSPPELEDDFVLWLEHQIELMRERQFGQLDLDNLLDELEYIVNSRRKALRTRLAVLIAHLLKCEFQPAHKSNSWIHTICTQRNALDRLIEQSPSLARHVQSSAELEYQRSLRQAVKETGLAKPVFPSELPYSKEQLIDFDFIP
ncbi:MAG: DUF29 domain-containing protein [Pseudomonadota bacterium]